MNIKDKSSLTLILIILVVGLFFRLYVSSHNHFTFHIDNARDMVDLREMVILKHWRLTGPSSGIAGVYNGPAWYYLTAIPYVLSGGDPYSLIIMEIVFWLTGGYFLLLLAKQWGKMEVIVLGVLWDFSNLILINSQNALSPNLIVFLMPLFIYFCTRYFEQKRGAYCLLMWLLSGLFFQLEMATGVFFPFIIICCSYFYNKKLIKSYEMVAGLGIFVAMLLPQVLFDFKHHFIMTMSVTEFVRKYLQTGMGFSLINKASGVIHLYQVVFSALVMNIEALMAIFLMLMLASLLLLLQSKKVITKEPIVYVCLTIIIVPFFGYLFLPFNVMYWHLSGFMISVLVFSSYSIYVLAQRNFFLPFLLITALLVVVNSIQNGFNHVVEYSHLSQDPALFYNEISAIDYTYNYASGKSFKIYTYIPSVIDYPYQYLFWWYGLKKYGYLPADYAYLPGMPSYISHKEVFSQPISNQSSNLIFLIEDPNDLRLKTIWLGNFVSLPFVSVEKIGSLDIEVRLAKEYN